MKKWKYTGRVYSIMEFLYIEFTTVLPYYAEVRSTSLEIRVAPYGVPYGDNYAEVEEVK